MRVNVPWWGFKVYQMCKPLLPKATLAKIKLFAKGCDFLPDLERYVERDQLPSFLGGTSLAPWPFSNGGDVPVGTLRNIRPAPLVPRVESVGGSKLQPRVGKGGHVVGEQADAAWTTTEGVGRKPGSSPPPSKHASILPCACVLFLSCANLAGAFWATGTLRFMGRPGRCSPHGLHSPDAGSCSNTTDPMTSPALGTAISLVLLAFATNVFVWFKWELGRHRIHSNYHIAL